MPGLRQVHLFLHEICVAIHSLNLSDHPEGIQSLQHVYPLSFLNWGGVSVIFNIILINVHELLVLLTRLNRVILLLSGSALLYLLRLHGRDLGVWSPKTLWLLPILKSRDKNFLLVTSLFLT